MATPRGAVPYPAGSAGPRARCSWLHTLSRDSAKEARGAADRIEEYRALGIENFVLSGYPHLEEAYRFGEG